MIFFFGITGEKTQLVKTLGKSVRAKENFKVCPMSTKTNVFGQELKVRVKKGSKEKDGTQEVEIEPDF